MGTWCLVRFLEGRQLDTHKWHCAFALERNSFRHTGKKPVFFLALSFYKQMLDFKLIYSVYDSHGLCNNNHLFLRVNLGHHYLVINITRGVRRIFKTFLKILCLNVGLCLIKVLYSALNTSRLIYTVLMYKYWIWLNTNGQRLLLPVKTLFTTILVQKNTLQIYHWKKQIMTHHALLQMQLCQMYSFGLRKVRYSKYLQRKK